MKKIVDRVLAMAGLKISFLGNFNELIKKMDEMQSEVSFLKDFQKFRDFVSNLGLSRIDVDMALMEFPKSCSQLHQDLFVLMLNHFKTGGYFVEFGATDGKKLSNTYLLEKTFAWSGILAEPGKRWHSALMQNRNAIIDQRCIWKNSGEELEFNETEVGELSTLQIFSSGDLHAEARKKGTRYSVSTISLEELLDENQAPTHIDYLSIDTEGSELPILSKFDFKKYSFGFISIEHNYTESRHGIFELLTSHGYKRIFEDYSLFDDWYVNDSLVKAKGLI